MVLWFLVISSSELACNDTVHVNRSTAISLHMTSSTGGSDVISRYPPSGCRLHVAARRGQRLSFTVFTLGGAGWSEQGWAEQVLPGGGGGGTTCDARRSLYIEDGGRTASSSLCRLPRFQSRHRLAYTTTHWRVAVHWTWTGHRTDRAHAGDDRFTSYVLKVEGLFCSEACAVRLFATDAQTLQRVERRNLISRSRRSAAQAACTYRSSSVVVLSVCLSVCW